MRHLIWALSLAPRFATNGIWVGRCLCGFAVSLVAISLHTGSAQATTIFDNFDAGGTFHPETYLAAVDVRKDSTFEWATRYGARFTVSGGSFLLDSITLPIGVDRFPASVPSDILRVRLTEDAAGAPGATLEILSESESTWPEWDNPFVTATALTSTHHPLLLEHSSYWIVLEPTSIPAEDFFNVTFRWSNNATLSTVFLRGDSGTAGALPSDPWTGPSFELPVAFAVEGTLVSEPTTTLLLATSLAILAWRVGAGRSD